MSLAEALARKKDALTAVEAPSSGAASAIDTAAALEQQQQQLDMCRQRVREADIEVWYDGVKEHTYPSVFMPISVDEARAMTAAFAHQRAKRLEATTGVAAKALEPRLVALLADVEARLQRTIDDFQAPFLEQERGLFVKLSSRSPKDATVTSGRTLQVYRDELSRAAVVDANAKLVAINNAHIKALRVENAQQAMALLLQSERICEDLEFALEKPDHFTQDIVVRRWCGIPLEYEFRCFIYNQTMNAISQYYHWCYFPHMVAAKDKIQQRLLAFFDSIKDKIPSSNYVLDLAWDEEHDRVLVIEINPFNEYVGAGTSGAMFDFKTDLEILTGRAPFEFRVETAPIDDTTLLKLVCQSWREIVSA